MKQLIYILAIALPIFTSCEEGGLLIETDISNRQVTIISPTQNAQVASNVVFFDWEHVEDATSYQMQVVTPNFNNASQLLLDITDSLTTTQLDLEIGDYQWRVRAKNSNYSTDYSTTSFKVVPVNNFSDNIVILSAPGFNEITNEINQNLQWEEIDGASMYRIQILEGQNIIDEFTSPINSIQVVFPEGNLNWQVRAENGIENTVYSSRSILVDATNPNTPILTLPEDEAILTSQLVRFEWERMIIDGSIEFDSIYVYRDLNLTDLVVKEEVTSPFETELSSAFYYWQMKSFDEAENESLISDVFSFSIN